MPNNDDEFNRMVQALNMDTPTESIDQNPYGGPVPSQKPGLTKRGKAALGIGVAVIAGGSLMGYQVHSANIAESEAKTQELTLKVEALELEKLREINRANEADRQAEATQAKARQTSVDACVKSHSDLVGKGFGSPSYRNVVEDCQVQYASSSTSDDLEVTASSRNASDAGTGVNDGLLIGGAVLVLFLVAAARKGTRSNPA